MAVASGEPPEMCAMATMYQTMLQEKQRIAQEAQEAVQQMVRAEMEYKSIFVVRAQLKTLEATPGTSEAMEFVKAIKPLRARLGKMLEDLQKELQPMFTEPESTPEPPPAAEPEPVAEPEPKVEFAPVPKATIQWQTGLTPIVSVPVPEHLAGSATGPTMVPEE